jgi:hypothetical protein
MPLLKPTGRSTTQWQCSTDHYLSRFGLIRHDGQACSFWHFAMKLFLAAPLSGLPSDPIALGSQASRLHFATKLVLAAPASGLPSFDTALLSHVPGAGVPCAAAELIADAISKIASINRVIVFLHRWEREARAADHDPPYRTGAFGAGTSARDTPHRRPGANAQKRLLQKKRDAVPPGSVHSHRRATNERHPA